jgi:mannose-6-phosphate isomerase
MDAEGFAKAVAAGNTLGALRRLPVRPGEVYFIPAGLPHAIGKGILIAEIQQNCDLTYRVYDYERRGADGSLRELHVDKALDVTVPFTEDEVNAIRYEGGAASEQTLAHCRYFKTDKLSVSATTALTIDERSFAFLLCLDGKGTITAGGESCDVSRADGYYLPAGLGEVTLDGNMTVLVARMG